MRRVIGAFLAVCMLWSFSAVAFASVTATSQTKYRALLVASDTTKSSSSLRDGPITDCRNMKAVLEQSSNVDASDIALIQPNYTSGKTAYSEVVNAICRSFADADDTDVNIFFYSGHGACLPDRSSGMCISNNSLLTGEKFRQIVEDNHLKGTFIIIADCCFSGGLVAKNASPKSQNEQFLDRFCAGFMENEMLLCEDEGLVGSSRFKVIAASSYQQTSLQLDDNGMFTTTACYGLGYDPFANTESYGAYGADFDNDGCVSVSELYRWTSMTNLYSDARCYPQYDDTTIVSYDREKYYGAFLRSASLQDPVVKAQKDAKITLNVEASCDCLAYVQTPMTYDGGGDSVFYGNLPILEAYKYYGTVYYNFLPGAYSEEILTPENYHDDRDTYDTTKTFTLDLSGAEPDTYYFRIFTFDIQTQIGNAVLLPFEVISDSANPDDFSVSLSTQNFITDPENCNELCITAVFGKTALFNSLPSAGVSLSCAIMDGQKVVRTLADRIPAKYVLDETKDRVIMGMGNYSYYYTGETDLYWDGKDNSGSYVPNGEYTVKVTAVYAAGETTKTALIPISVTTPVLRSAQLDDGVLTAEISSLRDYTVFAAKYEANGQMTEIQSKSFAGAANTASTAVFSFTPQSGCSYSLFLFENGTTFTGGISQIASKT